MSNSGFGYSSSPDPWWSTKPSKWKASSFLDPFGLFHSPKQPKYKPSELELETQRKLMDILEGKSPMFTEQDIERRYQTLKEKMLPEFKRLGKEAKISFARRGIRGGPEVEFEKRSAEDQLQRLMDARRRIEDETRRLEESRKSQALGQLTGMGRVRSQQEYMSEMQQFQQQMQEQQNMANMLASIAKMVYGVPPMPMMPDGMQQQQSPYITSQQQVPYSTIGWRV